jgi:hypothetical protein
MENYKNEPISFEMPVCKYLAYISKITKIIFMKMSAFY